MRIVVYNDDRVGLLRDSSVVDASDIFGRTEEQWPPSFFLRALRDFEKFRSALEERAGSGPGVPLSGVILRPPVLYPGKVIGAFANYAKHHREMRQRAGEDPSERQEAAEIFLKAPSSLIGSGGTVELPDLLPDQEVHHEVELALVIGKTAMQVREEKALGYVLGYTALMDLTLRGRGERSRRKSYDTFTPIGPALVTADEIPDPQNLRMRLSVNGVVRQDASTLEMTFTIPQIIAYASLVMTLFPGDIIATGTPEGVGPIRPGDTVTAEIERIGALTVTVGRREP